MKQYKYFKRQDSKINKMNSEIILKNLNKTSIVNMSKIINVKPCAIKKWLKLNKIRHKCYRQKVIKLNAFEINQLFIEYKKNPNITKLAQQFNITFHNVHVILKKYNLLRKKSIGHNHRGYIRLPVTKDRIIFSQKGKKTILEHRLVMARHLNRPLEEHENVHHINGVRTDNRLENLELWSKSQPCGQRVLDKVEWARQLLNQYENDIKEGKIK